MAIVTIASLGFLLFGYDQGVMGSLLSLPSFTQQFPSIDTINTSGAVRSHNSEIQGTMVAIYEVGGALGALFSLVFGNKLGPLKMIWAANILLIAGTTLQATAFQTAQLFVARVITGVGTGINTATIPVWQSEISPPQSRGKHLMIEGAMITWGVCMSYWIDFAFHYLSGSVTWRFPLAFQVIFALIICLVILDLPESPRHLLVRGKVEEARKVHEALAFDQEEETRQLGFAAIMNHVQEPTSGRSWKALFSNEGPSKNFHRFILAFIHCLYHQICGINLVIYYIPTIYQQDLGMGATETRIVNATVNGFGYFLSSFLAPTLIEKLGRRILMFIGSAGMAIGMFVAAIATALPSSKSTGGVAAAFLFIVQVAFAIGWLAIVWLYPAEIVPNQIRSQVNSIIVMVTWLFNFLIVEITPIMLNKIGYGSYIIFGVINIFIGLTIFLWFPETAGLSLEEVDEVFAQSNGIRDVVQVSLKMCREKRQERDMLRIEHTQEKENASSEHVENQTEDI